MDLPLFLLIEGVLFILVFGGMNLLRREGLSIQFALEALAITLLAAGITWLTGFLIHPVVLLIVVYLVTMRVRLLLDLGNMFARQRRFDQAERIYRLAGSLGPDAAGRLLIALNRATALLSQGQVEQSINEFRDILSHAKQDRLGDRYQAAARYNLGLAYLKLSQPALAAGEFRAVVDLLPISEFGRMARAYLSRDQKEKE